MKKVILLAFAIILSIGAMASKKNKRKKQVKKTINSVTEVKQVDKSNTMRLCLTPSPQPAWFLEVDKGFKFPVNFQQPADYRLLSTVDTAFNSFLSNIPFEKINSKIMLPLFINQLIECKEFNITRVVTMDPALQAKYPSLMSFKAFTSDNSLNAARIDCDGSSVKIMVTYEKKIYYITSLMYNKSNYYVCYAKDDPNFVKDKFER